ncbi:hypothetical protein I79_010409 [Cricetulus griseus]|uniref:Uncharacterized protein n=1 Tax=Cricetulus griseus TaxID=10029 RepID=G3HIE8_CRIGR|nr:hypothetical protein I79_010409 [Cricetulus griseus]
MAGAGGRRAQGRFLRDGGFVMNQLSLKLTLCPTPDLGNKAHHDFSSYRNRKTNELQDQGLPNLN